MAKEDQITGKIKYYPYRRALVSDVICNLPRSVCASLENKLAEMAGVRPDNHVVYELKQPGVSEPVYIWISDFTVSFARTVREYPNGY